MNYLIRSGGTMWKRQNLVPWSTSLLCMAQKRCLANASMKRLSSSLKQLMKPFFLKCHPDVQLTSESKRVNLAAVQTLNSFMDTLDATCEGKLVDWPKLLPIEFLLKTEEITARKKPKDDMITRRKVELVVPPVSFRDAILSSTGPQRLQSIKRLQSSVQKELAKLLQVAGLPIPNDIDLSFRDDQWDDLFGSTDSTTNHRAFGRRFETDERPKSRYEESREQFVASFDRKKFKEMYKEALQDLEAYLLTSGSIKKQPKLRQDMITRIIQRVRIDRNADIGSLDQLVTLRRLSLILEDNFEELHFEDYGKMWEGMTLILTGPRDYGTSDTALHRRRKRGQESGFLFTYGADNRVTITVPIDFRDQELLKELDRNLWDWANLVDDGGVASLFTKT